MSAVARGGCERSKIICPWDMKDLREMDQARSNASAGFHYRNVMTISDIKTKLDIKTKPKDIKDCFEASLPRGLMKKLIITVVIQTLEIDV